MLVAVAGTDPGQRTFRVDRIVEAESTDDPSDRPDGCALAAVWQKIVGEVE